MNSMIVDELRLKLLPVALLFTDEKPAAALQFAKGERGCLVPKLVQAAQGQTAVFDVHTVPCRGGMVGLEFADNYGNPEAQAYFLSVGGGPRGGEGEGYKKTPELVRAAMRDQPNVKAPETYRVFKPLAAVDPARETPRLVVFLANPDQISALTVLANYGRPTNDNVIVRFVSGCGSFCLLPDQLNQQEPYSAMLGMTDISARPHVPADTLSFTVPWPMFLEMEGNVRGSFFDREAWQKVKPRLPN
jgi:uncharacterized protein (DUF169 family)